MREEKEREAPERPGSEDDMTGTDKVLRDQPCNSQLLFVSRKGSATGGPACLVGAPYVREPLGWLVQQRDIVSGSEGALSILELCRRIDHPTIVGKSGHTPFFARGREG